MKKKLFFIAFALLFITFFSFAQKAKNLEDIKKKYEEIQFKTCDEYISAAEELSIVYFSTIKNGAKDDKNTKDEMLELGEILNNFNKQSIKLKKDCPDKLKAFKKYFKKEKEKYLDKILDIMDENHGFYYNIDYGDWDSEWREFDDNVYE